MENVTKRRRIHHHFMLRWPKNIIRNEEDSYLNIFFNTEFDKLARDFILNFLIISLTCLKFLWMCNGGLETRLYTWGLRKFPLIWVHSMIRKWCRGFHSIFRWKKSRRSIDSQTLIMISNLKIMDLHWVIFGLNQFVRRFCYTAEPLIFYLMMI